MTDDISKTIDEIIERHKETLNLLAKDDGPELKPCPFCGNSVELKHHQVNNEDWWYVACKHCEIALDPWMWGDYQSKEMAIEKWNRRAGE